MYALNLSGAVLLLSSVAVGAQDLLTDITQIQRHWGQLAPYADNVENYFGVEYVGLPDGCQVVSGRGFICSTPSLDFLGICSESPTPRATICYQRY